MRRLFDIGDDLLALEELLSDAGGEIGDDEAGQALERWFDELGEERDAKIDGYCALIREFEARAEILENEAERMLALAASDINSAKRLKQRLKDFFETQGIKSLNTLRFKIGVRKNSGLRPLLIPRTWEDDPASAPEAFHRLVIQLDKKAIRETLEAGETVEGCVIGAPGSHLRIQ